MKPYWHNFASEKLFGIEINDQISRVAKMNMIIHDDGHTNVIQHDGLFDIETIAKNSGNKGFAENSFDVITTNPPFGSIAKQSEKAYMQSDKRTAAYYDFSLKEMNWIDARIKNNHLSTGRENQSTEVLFIEQCHKFLKVNGYLAAVVPDGILTNSSLAYVRESIEEKYRIVAVVSLPQTAFTATSITEMKYLPKSMQKDIGNAFVYEDDFLISHSGTTGIVARVSKEFDGFAYGSFMIKFALSENAPIGKDYLSYFLNSETMEHIIRRNKIGAVQGNITIPTIKNLQIPLPPLEIQSEIANHIRNIRERAKTLETEAKELIEKAKAEVEKMILGE